MMSDIEEPPAKIIKMEGAPSSLDSTMEGHDEGQEEWLSEGVLTDDDYLPGNVSQDQMTINISEALNSTEPLDEESQPEQKHNLVKMEQNIEDALNDLEKTEPERDAFNELLKKEDKGSDIEQSDKHTDDDGHDTDDLLRMLGEDDGKMKKKVLTSMRDKKPRRHQDQSSEDDDYLFEGAKVTKLKFAKNAVIRKQPPKAEPEGLSDKDSDMSEDDVSTVKRMFGTKAKQGANAGQAQASRPFNSNKDKPTPKQYRNKSLLKPQPKKEHDEIINEEEFLDDDDFDLDEDVGADSSGASGDETRRETSQLIRRPERMDEDVPSDDESHSDDSLYDGLPSSDSEDMDDWFNLDIRAERAGDYLPWLGEKAHKLLTEEKRRVSARLDALKHSVTALKSSERVQSDQIKVATEALHELEAMLAAA